METTAPKIVSPADGKQVWLAGLGVRFMVPGADTGGGFALVEHPLKPRALGAPLHRHSREDEYSYVLKGRIGAQLGDDIVYANAGDLLYKPRGQWHAFWNPTDEDASLLEIIAPAGFETYFAEVAEAFKAGKRPDLLPPIAARYGLEIDPGSIPDLITKHGLNFD